MSPLSVIGFVVLAGAGSIIRVGAIDRWNTERFATGTLLVNAIAAFGAGLITQALAGPGEVIGGVPDDVLAALVIGAAMGSLSTYSTFAAEVVALIQDRSWGRAATYVSATILAAVGAAWLGLAL